MKLFNIEISIRMKTHITRQLHLWLSVPFGIIILLLCLSGAILLFENDLGHLGQAKVDSDGRTPVALDSIMREVERNLDEGKFITGVTIYTEKDHAYKIMLNKPAMSALWVDQYTGKVIGKYERADIFKIASSLHRRLFGKSKAQGGAGGAAGKLIIGISSIVLLIVLVTGLILWWPMRRQFCSELSLGHGKSVYKKWFDLHSSLGVIATAILCVCILTGLTWSFGWYRKGFYGLMGTEVAKSTTHKDKAENFESWNIAANEMMKCNGDKEIRMYQGEGDVVIGGLGNQQATDTYYFDEVTGEITGELAYDNKSKSNHIKGWIYTLHIGSWCGLFSRILYLFAVLFGAFLPISGYYLWIKRLARKRVNEVV